MWMAFRTAVYSSDKNLFIIICLVWSPLWTRHAARETSLKIVAIIGA